MFPSALYKWTNGLIDCDFNLRTKTVSIGIQHKILQKTSSPESTKTWVNIRLLIPWEFKNKINVWMNVIKINKLIFFLCIKGYLIKDIYVFLHCYGNTRGTLRGATNSVGTRGRCASVSTEFREDVLYFEVNQIAAFDRIPHSHTFITNIKLNFAAIFLKNAITLWRWPMQLLQLPSSDHSTGYNYYAKECRSNFTFLGKYYKG